MNESVTKFLRIHLSTFFSHIEHTILLLQHLLLLCKSWGEGSGGGTNTCTSASPPSNPVFPFSMNGCG